MRIGVLGAGQLGRMLALAGYPLGNEFVFYDLSGNPSAGLGEIIVDRDHERLADFIARVDRVTYEFEHLPVEIAEIIAREKPVHPSPRSLQVCQNRAAEKTLFGSLRIPTAQWRMAETAEELHQAATELGFPVVAKSNTEGYDGKGQAVIRSGGDCQAAWQSIGHSTLIVEQFVDFQRELSVIAARSEDGEVAVYPLAENVHHDGILRYSMAPAPQLSEAVAEDARLCMATLLDELDYVGVLALELFETTQGLVANEMAPRVHNSGHWTMNGAMTSQFENHIRAISGMPLGNVAPSGVHCMVNIIGEHGNPADLLKLPYAHTHLYGKQARPGRKLGHVNVFAQSYEELLWRARNVSALLPGTPELACSLGSL